MNMDKITINKIEEIEGHKVFVEWRVEINEEWFIERGHNTKEVNHASYISLVRKAENKETEVLLCNNNFSDSWRLLNVDSAQWGDKLLIDIEPNDEAAIKAMTDYFKQNVEGI